MLVKISTIRHLENLIDGS